MKMILILSLLVTGNAFAQAAKTGQIHKTVAAAGTPERVTATDLYVRAAYIQCSSANTGTSCFFGNSITNAVAARGMTLAKPTATAISDPIQLGDLSHGAGPKVNLKDIWVDVATNGDEVNVFYIE